MQDQPTQPEPTFDIADNNNFAGPETVDVAGVYAFQISGGCTWYRVG